MNGRIVMLTRDVLQEHLDQLLLMDRGTPGERWERDHFLHEMPGKWLSSRLATDDAGNPTGFLVASIKPDAIHVHRVVVKATHRGQGIGTRLLQAVAQSARERAIPTITLKVPKSNTDAIRLYQRLGFQASDGGPINWMCAVPTTTLLENTSRAGRSPGASTTGS